MNQRAAEPVVFALLGTAHVVEARLEDALQNVGLSLAKAGLLRVLHGAGEPMPLAELAQHLKCVRSNITQLVDRLEKDGLVRRRADPDDRRSVRASLTPAGRRAHAKANQALADVQRTIMEGLGTGQVDSLKAALEVLGR